MISFATEGPISLGKVWVPPAPGMMASVVSTKPSLALSAAEVAVVGDVMIRARD